MVNGVLYRTRTGTPSTLVGRRDLAEDPAHLADRCRSHQHAAGARQDPARGGKAYSSRANRVFLRTRGTTATLAQPDRRPPALLRPTAVPPTHHRRTPHRHSVRQTRLRLQRHPGHRSHRDPAPRSQQRTVSHGPDGLALPPERRRSRPPAPARGRMRRPPSASSNRPAPGSAAPARQHPVSGQQPTELSNSTYGQEWNGHACSYAVFGRRPRQGRGRHWSNG